MNPTQFQQAVLAWFNVHGRKNLPWQQSINPYRVWVSEIMLQQTQVATVIPYYQKFMTTFPTVETLANASIDEVLQHWSGLGYYARARNLHKAAQTIVNQGYFPDTLEDLMNLSGIGQSTAGAILSIAFNKPHPILDGNVKRVLSRFYAVEGWAGEKAVSEKLWKISANLTPLKRGADYTQAMMDLGATLCTRSKPLCLACPLNVACVAYQQNVVSAYPTPKPSKKLLIKSVFFLILRNENNAFFLEKRPESGIWGGLWSFPEFETEHDLENWLVTQKIPILDKQTLVTKRHTFSHYHLDYIPILIKTNKKIQWQHADTILNLGLPAPIKLLINTLIEKNYENDLLR